MFMTKFPNGKPTDFERKIKKSFDPHLCEREDLKQMIVHGTVSPFIFPKLHTLRQSKRIKSGMDLSMRNWVGKPYRTKQNEFQTGKCKGTQDVKIFSGMRDGAKFVEIYVDDRLLDTETSQKLAINDGFDNYMDFVDYFHGKEFDGQIIHWTELRY